MEILHSDRVVRVSPGEVPNYNHANPLLVLTNLIEDMQFAVDREWYLRDQLQYLFPIDALELYGPQGGDADILDPARQDNKTDFQKQNVKSFTLAPTRLVRGWVTTGPWTGPFLRMSYQAGPDTPLWGECRGSPGTPIRLWLKVNGRECSKPLVVPYNNQSGRYEVELWSYSGEDLRKILRDRSLDALNDGGLVSDTSLIRGNIADFDQEKLNGRDLREISPDCAMHPILPLHVECAWADNALAHWDSNHGLNYHYEFNMKLRGWDHFLSGGTSANPHGGVGLLEYRNLLSNYGRFAGSNELQRTLESWNFDAFGNKTPSSRTEPFMAVDYMDLHIVRSECGIGLHRHRDNQEAFLMVDGRALMVVGDWCKIPERERCLEVRILRAGHMALLKGGNLHGLLNTTDERILLFMFGGYD
jgi:mannose-6-phosphate isomerase-like protein (cupin superfamily)